ncbi:DUF4255 domain-containing protein [Streptomyces sp. NPDC021093]|uniref:DUF4255 domain-containing protein n=1 Tax=Streptomyces sp. NPDC021093 TaxID=3365112 RepID=UPI0037BA6E80
MSNPLAVAMVTAVLGRVLAEALVGAPPGGAAGAGVSTLRPDMLAAAEADGKARGINVFLYQVVPNGSWGSVDLPTRRADGTLLTRPQQALDLHYLLTFCGDESTLEPQRALGVAVSTLAARPLLSRELVRDTIRHAIERDPASWEQFSDLADQIDIVRLTLMPLSLEELSKLWSTFHQAAYRLSVGYRATVVLLDSADTPQPALPVLSRGIDVFPNSVPLITRVTADSAPTAPVRAGTLLRIEGQRLRGPLRTLVRVGGVEAEVPDGRATGTRLTVPLPAGVRAGVQGVQVLQPRTAGDPPQERGGAESNVSPVTVRPTVAGEVTTAPGDEEPDRVRVFTVPLDPPAGPRQRVVLLLNEHRPPGGRTARAYTFLAPPPGAEGAPDRPSVAVPTTGVEPGTYLVRVQVDGAESVLTTGDDGRYDLPRVTVTAP